MGAYQNTGIMELENDPKKVRCLPCQAHVFGASPFQRKALKKHLGSKAHHHAVYAAAEAEAEEAAARIRVRRIDAWALKAEARFTSLLSGELPTKPAPRTFVGHNEMLREREMWERFEVEGFEQAAPFCDDNDEDSDEENFIDIALRRRFKTINLGMVGPTESNPFYDDGDETITNVMREIGNAVYSSVLVIDQCTQLPYVGR